MRRPAVLDPDPLRFEPLGSRQRILVVAVLVVIAAALVCASLPPSWLAWSGSVEFNGGPYGPFAAGLLAIAMVAAAARLVRRGSMGARSERPVAAVLGVVAAVLCGAGLRQFLQLLVLRRGWRPLAMVQDPARVLPVLWMYVAGAVLAAGFLIGLLAVVDAVVSRVMRRWSRFGRVRAVLGSCSELASWVPAALVALFVVGQMVLGQDLLVSLGAIFPTTGGTAEAAGAEVVFLGMWPELSSLAVMQFALGLWAAVELARLVHTEHTAAGPRATRAWAPVAVTGIAVAAVVAALWRSRRDPAALVTPAGAALVVAATVTVIAIHLSPTPGDPSGRRRNFPEIAAMFPRSAGDLAVVVPILMAMGAALLWEWGQVALRAVEGVLRFPGDAAGYWDYWQLVKLTPFYSALTVVDVVRPGFIGAAVIAGLIVYNHDQRREVSRWALPLFIGLAVLSSRLDDLNTFLLLFAAFTAACYVLARVSDYQPDWWLPVTGVGILCAFAIIYLLTPDLPLTLVLAGSIALRFGWQAGELNAPAGQSTRLELSLALPLLLAGLLLAERAAGESAVFAGQSFASLGQTVGLPFVGIPVVCALGTIEMWRRVDPSSKREPRLATTAPRPSPADEELREWLEERGPTPSAGSGGTVRQGGGAGEVDGQRALGLPGEAIDSAPLDGIAGGASTTEEPDDG